MICRETIFSNYQIPIVGKSPGHFADRKHKVSVPISSVYVLSLELEGLP